MNDFQSLDRDQLLQHVAQQATELAQKDAELRDRDEELRRRDIALQEITEKLAATQLESDNWKDAYARLEQRFLKRSERYIHDPKQLELDLGDTDEAADAANGLAEAVEDADLDSSTGTKPKRRPRKKRDESLPAHLPRYEVVLPVPDDVKTCTTHGERKLLPESMWERTETLEYAPPQRRVRVTIRQTYACADAPDCGIAAVEAPVGIVEGNKYGTSVAAEIITHKYGYHLPIYRQQDYCAASGWTASRSTLLNILTGAFFVLTPLLAYFRRTLQGDSIVGCDDTGLMLLYPKVLPTFDLTDAKQRRMDEVFRQAMEEKKPSIGAKMWAYRGQTIPLNVFDFTVSRHRDGPELFFADFQGTLVGDCWHGFEAIACNSSGTILRAACNAHARRKIKNSKAYPEDRKQWLHWFQQLYEIDGRGKRLSAEEHLAMRQTEAKPIWDAMESWLEEAERRTTNVILPKSDFAQALQYIRNHFTPLKRYLDDPLVPIDNNETEHLMRQVALGRKNWLFAGSVAGGERSAGFLTMVSSAIRNDLSVWHYLEDVLTRLLAGETNYEPFLPWNWAAEHPEAIRQYRITERQDRAQRKQARREDRRRSK